MVSEPFVVMSFCYLSQIVIWIVIPSTRNGRADHANNTLSLIVLIQYIPRLFVIFPLHQRIIKSRGSTGPGNLNDMVNDPGGQSCWIFNWNTLEESLRIPPSGVTTPCT